jgi:leucyl aminopeptidase
MQFTLLRADDLVREKFVGVTAVGVGSVNPPVMFAMNYKGGRSDKVDLALVGKGISFDTGGIDLKPFDHMWEMKTDMAGAGAVIHTMQAIAELGLKKNVVAIIPSAENRPDAKAYLPGDILRYKNGVTVEVHSTDAEGRLILADGLIWAQEKFKAARVIDVATLTGACVRALGLLYTGLMCNNDGLAKKIMECGAKRGEKFWPLPLPAEYNELLLSSVAKVKNIGGANAGASTAGLFLQNFITEGTAWAHLDIAGSSFYESRQRYYMQPGSTGVMVRTLTELAASL